MSKATAAQRGQLVKIGKALAACCRDIDTLKAKRAALVTERANVYHQISKNESPRA